MKLFQKGVAVLLAIIISTQSTALAYAETAEPTTVQTEDGVTFTHNSDGTVTATVYPKMEVRAMSAAPMTNILEDQGDSYASTGDNISLRLGKTYTDGEMLVSIESNGAGISFYPETNAGQQIETELESSASSVLVSGPEDEQTGSNEPTIESTDEGVASTAVKEDAQPESQEKVEDQPETAPAQPTADAGSDPSAESSVSASQLANYVKPSIAKVSTLAYTDAGSNRTAHLLGSDVAGISDILASEDTPAPTGTPVPTATPIPSPSPTAEPEKEDSGKVHIYSSVDGIGCGGMGGGYSAILYPGAINEYTDIEISPLERGMKENIIMHRYTTSQLSYVLSFQGLTPVQSGSSILLYDAAGNTAATISAPYMYDASGNYNYDITAGIEPAEGGYRLTYYMDEAWLKNAVYPVTLDPSIEFSYDYDYYKFIENSFVSSKFPDQTASQFAFSEQALTTGLYKSGYARAYLRMVFPDSLIETLGNAIIEKLELHLYIIDGGGEFTMHQVTGGSWSASNITWNNAPSFDPEPLDQQQISVGWTTWDLTRRASNWFNSPTTAYVCSWLPVPTVLWLWVHLCMTLINMDIRHIIR